MNQNRWRVKRLLIDAVSIEIAERVKFAVWGIWPPQWDITGEPLLYFPLWRQAFNSALSRADFSEAPDREHQRNLERLRYGG